MNDQDLNKSNKHYQDTFDRFGVDPKRYETDPDRYNTTKKDAKNAKEAETNPDTPFNYNIGSKNSKDSKPRTATGKLKSKGAKGGVSKLKRFKQVGPIVGLFLGVGTGASLLLGSVSSSMLILNHITELIKDKSNPRVFIQDQRAHKLMLLKLQGGDLDKASTREKRYRTFSDAQLSNLKWQGLEVEDNPDGGKQIVNRKYPEDSDYPYRVVTKNNYLEAINKDVGFRDAVYKANRVEYGTTFDPAAIKTKIINKVTYDVFAYKALKATKKALNSNFAKNLDDVASGRKQATGGLDTDDLAKKGAKAGIEETTETVGEEAGEKLAKEIGEESGEAIGKSLKKGAKGAGSAIFGKMFAKVANVFRVTDTLDYYCNILAVVRGADFAAKLYKRQNLIRLGMAYLSVADQAKVIDGQGGRGLTEEQIGFMGNKLTQVNAESDVGLADLDLGNTHNALDAYGVKYLEGEGNDDSPIVDPNANPKTKESLEKVQIGQNPEVAGATGGFIDLVRQTGGGPPDVICQFKRKPLFQIIEISIGIGFAYFSGGTSLITSALPDIAQGVGLEIAMIAIGRYITESIISAATGNLFDSSTTGEDLGNVIVAGGSAQMNEVALHSGAGVLDQETYARFKSKERIFLAQKAEMVRYNTSPWDITTRHTFLGSIVAKILPYSAKIKTFSGQLKTVAHLSKSSFLNLLPGSSALAAAKDINRDLEYMKVCQDPGTVNMLDDQKKQVATDPFCNVLVGIEPDALSGPDYEPLTVLHHLQTTGDIDNQNNVINDEDNDIHKYRRDCTNRDGTPISIKPEEGEMSNGNRCLIDKNSDTIYYALYFTDEFAQCNLDGGANCQDQTSAAKYQQQRPATNTLTGDIQPANLTEAVETGWGGHSNGRIPLTDLTPVTPGGSDYLHPMAAKSFRAMSKAYQAETGNSIPILEAYRDYDAQVAIKKALPGNATDPGKSNHGWGLAVDLNGGFYNFDTPEYNWMKANANQFGFCHPAWAEPTGYRQEAWHWEYCVDITAN